MAAPDDLLHAEAVKEDILHSDETTMQVVKEAGRTATRKSYMWLYHTGKYAERHIALYEYQPTREKEAASAFLKGFEGYLHVDGYAGYKHLENLGVTLVECWAHARRKFDEALKALPKEDRVNAVANVGFVYCNKLFELERQYDEANLTPDERKGRRETESSPVAEAFFSWAKEKYDKALPKSLLFKALEYAVNQEKWLMNFLLDGRLELSNNRAEGSIRPFTTGRKNWLFSFTANGAKASAVAYSIVETAMLNGLVPFLYINYLLQALPNSPKEQWPDFLPWNQEPQEFCRVPNLLDSLNS